MKHSSDKTGRSAERLCRLALRLKFYRILASRFKTPMGEIDIIAARGHTIIAIEVKARGTQDNAAFAISAHQQQRIAAALEHYIQRNPCYTLYNLRFDAMLVAPRHWPKHITNAWRLIN